MIEKENFQIMEIIFNSNWLTNRIVFFFFGAEWIFFRNMAAN